MTLDSSKLATSQWTNARPSRFWSITQRLLLAVFLIAASVAGYRFAEQRNWFLPQSSAQAEVTTVARRATLPITVIAGGELEAAATVDVFSEVEGQQIKIVTMIPEGTLVKAGAIVMSLDPSEVKRLLSEQEIRVMKADTTVKTAKEEVNIQGNLAATSLANAQLAKTLAELDRKKYLEGEHKIAISDLKGQIALAESGLHEAEVMVEAYEKLVKKGFRTSEQMRAKEQDLARAKHSLTRDQEKLRVLESFTFARQSAELSAKAIETARVLERLEANAKSAASKAKSDLAASETTHRWEIAQLEKFKSQLANCQVKAPSDGVVVYAKQEGKRVELGATVHFKQQLFSLPDMKQMQVKAFVHESALRRIEPGQKADIRIDAFPDDVLTGTIESIDSFYDSVRHWTSGGVKEYATKIKIDTVPAKMSAKPGMSANVQIKAGQLSNALVLPFTAVADQEGKYFCFIVQGELFVRREVTLGDNTESHVEVSEGLQEGEIVVMNARQRLLSDVQSGSASEAAPETEKLVGLAAAGN